MTRPSPPRAAFIVPAHDAIATLAEAVRSALAQTEPEIEVVIVDDGSSDSTAELARDIASSDRRVQWTSQRNAGPGAARNAGVALATAPYLCFLDADDLVAPGKVAAQADLLDAEPSLAVVYSGTDFLHEEGADDGIHEAVEIPGDALVAELLDGGDRVFPLHAALLRRTAFDGVGGFRELRPLVEDLDLWVRIAFTGARFRYAAEPRVTYRQRRDSRSRATSEVLEGRLPALEWLAARLPESSDRGRRVRARTRYRSIVLAGRLARDGRTAQARRLLLRTLRWGRRPGAVAEVLRLLLRPRSAAAPHSSGEKR